MPDQEPNFTWDESSGTLCVGFPAPPPQSRSPGCAMALLVAAIVLTIPLPLLLLCNLIDGQSVSAIQLCAWAIGMVITGCLVWYAKVEVRKSRLPPGDVPPSLLTVREGVLLIERAGSNRDMDYRWEVREIADIRLCPSEPDRALVLGWRQALAEDELIRISVMDRRGEVDDVMVRAPGRYWTDALEERLRAYLGLTNESAPSGSPI